MTRKAFVRATRPTFLCASPQTNKPFFSMILTGSSPLEELHRSESISRKMVPLGWDCAESFPSGEETRRYLLLQTPRNGLGPQGQERLADHANCSSIT